MKDTTTIGNSTPELTTEEREEYRTLLIGEKAQDAMEFQEWACLEFGPAAGILCRELLFWDNRGVDDDGWIYKTEEELTRKGLSRHFQRKARATLIRRGVLEEEKRGIPCQLWYRLRLGPLMEIRFPQDATDAPEPENVESVETETQADEPDHEGICDLPDFEDCFECGAPEGHEPHCSLYDDPERVEGQRLNPDYSPTRKGVEQARHARESNKSDALGSRAIQKEHQKEPQESSVLHTGEPHFSNAPAGEEKVNHEVMSTPSTPSVRDSLGDRGTEDGVSINPPETAPPISAREGLAMLKRGEVTSEELVVLLDPRKTVKEVA
jgi:hypothetical protein